MRQRELYQKVQLLKDGQVVRINGDFFQACKLAEAWEGRACEACDLDSICKGDVALVCDALDRPFYGRYYLKLAHPA